MEFLIEYGWVWAVGLGGFLALWPVSLVLRDCSVVDLWWGPGFGAMALTLWWAQGQPLDPYTLAILVPLVFWAFRLGAHLGLRRVHEGAEDPRYGELRTAWSPGWEWKSLFIVFLLQGVLQFLIASSVLAGLAAASGREATVVTYLASAAALAFAAVEAASDLQLDAHRRRAGPGALLTTGLRAVVRYPSYAAEIGFWSALSVLALGAGVWWAPVSALVVGLLLRWVSGVTVLDERLSRTRPEFAAYSTRVPALMPRLPFAARREGGRYPAE